MLVQTYTNGDFFVVDGVPHYNNIPLTSGPAKPLFTSGDAEVYFLVMPREVSFKYLVIVQSRYPAFYPCKGVDFGENGLTTKKFTLKLLDGSTKIFREEDAGGYPHEDVTGKRLVTW